MKPIYSLAIAAAIAATTALPLHAQSTTSAPLDGPADNAHPTNGAGSANVGAAPRELTGVEHTQNKSGGGDNEQPSVPANGMSGSSRATTPSQPGVSETAPRVGTSGTDDKGVMNR